MLGHFGFSYIGLVWLLMLFLPNLIWTKNRPAGYDPQGENKVLLWFERIGQVCVTCTALIFSDFNLRPFSAWSLWLLASLLCMLLYECWWVRYFKSEKTLADFYSSFLGIPVAGATLPVLAFFLLGIYGKVIWLLLSAVILGVGHIGIHLAHCNAVRNAQRDSGLHRCEKGSR
jgi:hypothetical protein